MPGSVCMYACCCTYVRTYELHTTRRVHAEKGEKKIRCRPSFSSFSVKREGRNVRKCTSVSEWFASERALRRLRMNYSMVAFIKISTGELLYYSDKFRKFLPV